MTESRDENSDVSPSRTTIMCANLSVRRFTGRRQHQLRFPRLAAAHQYADELATAVHGGDLLGVLGADSDALTHRHGSYQVSYQRGVGERAHERRRRRE